MSSHSTLVFGGIMILNNLLGFTGISVFRPLPGDAR